MAEDEPAPTTITKTANALAQAAEFALASLVNLGWTWPNIAFAIAAAATAATGRFPRSATIPALSYSCASSASPRAP